jgi:hypothetical protein
MNPYSSSDLPKDREQLTADSLQLTASKNDERGMMNSDGSAVSLTLAVSLRSHATQMANGHPDNP